MNSEGITGSAKSAVDKIEKEVTERVGDVREQVDKTIDRAKESVQDAYSRTREAADDYASEARDRVRDAASWADKESRRYVARGRRYVDESLDELPDHLRDGQAALSRTVEGNPLAALLIAGAVGYGLALLLHGRR